MKKWISWTVVLALLLSCSACASGGSDDLMATVETREIIGLIDLDDGTAAAADFGIQLFRQSFSQAENTLISPLSVLCALAMTANGAKEETLAQMEQVLGMNVDTLNSWICAYRNALSESSGTRLTLANSIWLRDTDSFAVDPDFLQINADYYGAGVFKAPFDAKTCREINEWVETNTDGLIRDILDQIPASVVMYLVNALAFEAQWQNPYEETAIWEAEFTTAEGEKQTVQMMHSAEHIYLEDDKAKGFVKYYEGGDYAFVALLPDQGVDIGEYVDSLTGDKLLAMLQNAQSATVQTAMPRFEQEYAVEMSEILKVMGMENPFDGERADFSGIGTSEAGNLFISRVLHKTFIRVDGLGTKAGAATVVAVDRNCALEQEEPKSVTLDRPYVYLLIDTKTNLPFFIGTMMEPGGDTIPEPALSSAPELEVLYGEDMTTVGPGNCSWRGPAVNGQTMEYIACGAHPLDNTHEREFSHVHGERVTLSFPVTPDSVTVFRWNASDMGNVEAPGEQVVLEDMSFIPEPGEWVYEITARWEREAWGGEAGYALYLTS